MNPILGSLNVHFLPRDVAETDLAGSAVIVIDLLRATSTISQALASSATEVIPFLEIEDAVAAANKVGRKNVILGGERRGGKISGFDVGNSPAEYSSKVVGGKQVFITTTNGTRALHHARLANRVLAGAFVNLSAVVASLKNEPRVDILCAGTDRDETREDILAAGAFVAALSAHRSCSLNAAAKSALDEWHAVTRAADVNGRALNDQVALELRETQGGRNLIGIGLDRDLIDCAQIDRHTIVPELDIQNWRIVAPAAENSSR